MISGKKVVALIPARLGSKGVPRKNLQLMAGIPMIGWTIRAAKASMYIDRIIVSTESEEIADSARKLGADIPFLRPMSLAEDTSSTMDVVLHALNSLEGDNYSKVVLLQPTSPLRSVEDIDAVIAKQENSGAKSCVSVSSFQHPLQWLYKLDADSYLRSPFNKDILPSRRQDADQVYMLNGAVYAADIKWLAENKSFMGPDTLSHIMPPERSIDIDTHFDFFLADLLLKNPFLEVR